VEAEMSKALDALHAHLKKMNHATPRAKENEIICRINKHMDLIILDLLKLSRHTQNRIAAHKAHVTMAKKKASHREGAKDAKVAK
jgi:hypothetical protein